MSPHSLKPQGITNVSAVHWNLPTGALYEKIVSRGEKSPKKLLPLSLVFILERLKLSKVCLSVGLNSIYSISV